MNESSSFLGSQFFTLIIVFFFWGYLAAAQGVFIPFCKVHFNLSQLQAQLIGLAFYFAYFIGSLMLTLADKISGISILNSIGYKMGIIYGLFISALGAIFMIGSVHLESYSFILGSLFIIGLGCSLQQACAQPFATALGDPRTATHRLNMAGGINSFGSMVGPLILAYFLFGNIRNTNVETVEISSINYMFLGLAILFGAVALFFKFSGLPKITNNETIEEGFGALKYPQVILGMIGIFIYVGTEVTIQSNMGALLGLPEFGGMTESEIAPFISLYWGSLMIGRWTGGIAVFGFSKKWTNIITIILPFIAFGIILFVNNMAGNKLANLYPYAFFVAILVIGFLAGQEKPVKTLIIFSSLGIIFMLAGLFNTGMLAVFSFIAGGLCCSVMWPSIFALSLSGLGKYTGQASTFLVMMILGGAVIPTLQGYITDSFGPHISYWIPAACFVYILFFALRVGSILKYRGIIYEK